MTPARLLLLFIGVLFGIAEPASAQFAAQQTWAQSVGGTGNAITLTIPGGASSWVDFKGVPVRWPVAANNSGATTVNINGLGAVHVKKLTGSGLAELRGGEFVAGSPPNIAVGVYDGTELVITSASPTITPTANTVIGFTTSGTYTPSPGVTRVYVQVWAGGGGGFTVGSVSHHAGDGGGGAEYRQGVFSIVPGTGVTVTVGGGGAANTNGTASSFGSYVTSNPGHGATNYAGFGPGAGGSGGSGGFGFPGYTGGGGFTTNGNDNLSGQGGAAFGTSISYGPANPSLPGNFPGGGGEGGNGGGSTPAGGAGAGGLVLVQELSSG